MTRRTIQATDREWETIRIRAKAEGMTISDFVMACGLFKKPKTEQQSEIPIEEPAMPRAERLAFYNELHDLVNRMTLDTEYLSRPMPNATITSPSGEDIAFHFPQVITAIYLMLQRERKEREKRY